MLNIIYVTREYPPSRRIGGIAIYVQEMAEKFAANGDNIHVVCASDSPDKDETSMINGVWVHRLPNVDYSVRQDAWGRLISLLRTILFFWQYRVNVADRIDMICKRDQIDLIEFTEFGAEGYVWLRRKRNVPFIIRMHGPSFFDNFTGKKVSSIKRPMSFLIGKFEAWQLKQAKYITTPSAVFGKHIAKLIDIDESRIKHIPNAINVDYWSITDNSSLHNVQLSSEKVTIFSAGTVAKTKGFEELYDSCKILRQNGIAIDLTIAGRMTGRYARQLVGRIRENGDDDWFRLIGPIPRNDLRKYYQNAELVIFPSWWEPFGIVCIEAMASGALVVGSRSGGMSEIIIDNETGFLVEPKDATNLAKKVQSILILDISRRERIRYNAKQAVKEKYSSNTVSLAACDYYRSTI